MNIVPGFVALIACLAAPATAQVAGSPPAAPEKTGPACEVTAQGEIIRIAVCDGPGSDAQLAAFGRTTCEGALPCGVWFWTSAAAAPAEAPANHDGLTQAEVTASSGVFVAEQDMFIRIEQVGR